MTRPTSACRGLRGVVVVFVVVVVVVKCFVVVMVPDVSAVT